jgi:CheY-like chemotaxis protein
VTAAAPGGPPTRRLRVLLVEDDEDHVFLIRRALRDLRGVAVSLAVARSGEQALRWLAAAGAEQRPLPQLVLLDLRTPRLHGLEVLRRLRADSTLRRLPVVVLTSSDHPDDRDQALRLGARHYLSKPLDGASFRTTVQTAARNATPPP